jgi:hypothetical protein
MEGQPEQLPISQPAEGSHGLSQEAKDKIVLRVLVVSSVLVVLHIFSPLYIFLLVILNRIPQLTPIYYAILTISIISQIIGVILMWKWTKWSTKKKVIISLALAVPYIQYIFLIFAWVD